MGRRKDDDEDSGGFWEALVDIIVAILFLGN